MYFSLPAIMLCPEAIAEPIRTFTDTKTMQINTQLKSYQSSRTEHITQQYNHSLFIVILFVLERSCLKLYDFTLTPTFSF